MSEWLPATSDVLVVGAGPVGLALAAALRAEGIGVVVADQQAEGANTSRACVVHARTLETLNGLGVTEELLARGLIVPRFTIRDRDKVLMTLDFGGLPTEYPYTLMIPQNVTEAVLLARLHALGGQVHRPCRVTTLAQDADGVTATTDAGQTIRARYAVGADGMHSAVREQAGIGFAGDSYRETFVLADVRMEWALPASEVMLFLSPAGLAVVAPLPGGRHRIVATADGAPEHPDLACVQELMDARGPAAPPAKILSVGWASRFHVHHRLAARYRAGRILLAGDAAHVHSPAGGQGMNTGLQDAVALAARLVPVLTGAPATILDGYEEERRPVAEGVVALTDRMTRAATVSSVPLRKLRNSAIRVLDWLPAAHRMMAMNLSELSTTPGPDRRR
jgi:2-polyprenyl-6-methoxyphenol hydroxylase-like FAD-dependent oxidoreductase